jgi:hypothetical protein
MLDTPATSEVGGRDADAGAATLQSARGTSHRAKPPWVHSATEWLSFLLRVISGAAWLTR